MQTLGFIQTRALCAMILALRDNVEFTEIQFVWDAGNWRIAR